MPVTISAVKSSPDDSIVKLPGPVKPDVAAKYDVGLSLIILSVPALIVVDPVYVLNPVKFNKPVPALIKLAVLAPLEIIPDIVLVPELVTDRLLLTLMSHAVRTLVVIVKSFKGLEPPTAPDNVRLADPVLIDKFLGEPSLLSVSSKRIFELVVCSSQFPFLTIVGAL